MTYKVVKSSKWYDPEGLNIDSNDAQTLFVGTMDDCRSFLERKNKELSGEYSDRKDIHVDGLTPIRKLLELRPLPTGGWAQVWGDVIGYGFEVYFMSAMSKEVYTATIQGEKR